MRLPCTVKGLMSVILILAITFNGLLGMRLCHDESGCVDEEVVSPPHCACEHDEEASIPLAAVVNLGDCGRSCACMPVQQNWRVSPVLRSTEQARDKVPCNVLFRNERLEVQVPLRKQKFDGCRPSSQNRLNPSLTSLRTVVLLT
jgi:hypothetical protein